MTKKVIVRHSFDIEEEWDEQYATKDHIEFYYNEGTSCADNILDKIIEYQKQIQDDVNSGHTCLCHCQSSEVIEIK